MLWKNGAPKLRAVATDMHRLYGAERDVPSVGERMPVGIVSRNTINDITNTIEDADKPIQIGMSEIAYISPLTAKRPKQYWVLA